MKIYLTRANTDMTEGRGGMRTDKAFTTKRLAEQYLDDQSGVMGSKPALGNGWDIIEIDVYDRVPDPLEEVRARALAKLTEAEKRALGLK